MNTIFLIAVQTTRYTKLNPRFACNKMQLHHRFIISLYDIYLFVCKCLHLNFMADLWLDFDLKKYFIDSNYTF